jgi:phosphoenolpyruvate carboxykinase (GTP)
MLSKEYDNPKGVPISAIIVGGRRTQLIPLVVESFDWQHGVYLAARMGSETTAAAVGLKAGVRRDPMAMLPFCGYNMGDYFKHWLNMGKKMSKPPKIYSVNWFRQNEEGKFMWPGFGDNIRVIEWIIKRVTGTADAEKTPIGSIPAKNGLNLDGLKISESDMAKLFEVKLDEWKDELDDTKKFLDTFGKSMPAEILDEHNKLVKQLK